jgi:hypothetical protein
MWENESLKGQEKSLTPRETGGKKHKGKNKYLKISKVQLWKLRPREAKQFILSNI